MKAYSFDPLGPWNPKPWPPGTLKAYPWPPWDPAGLPLDPLTRKAYHLTPWYLRHYTYIQAYMPYESSEDPVGLPLDPLGSWIGIKVQLADLSRPIRPCLFYTLDECIWPMKRQLSTLPNFPDETRKIPHATYCQKSWNGWRTLKYWSYKKSIWDYFMRCVSVKNVKFLREVLSRHFLDWYKNTVVCHFWKIVRRHAWNHLQNTL